MRFFPDYEQSDPAAVAALVDSLATATLVTQGPDGVPRAGIYNPWRLPGSDAFLLHLHHLDEQAADLAQRPAALLVFQDILATIPSYWVDAHYGGAATQYFKYAEFQVMGTVIKDPDRLTAALQVMLDHYQPERGYDPLRKDAKIYRGSIASLLLVELRPVGCRTKWKLGQNRPEEIRRNVAARLAERGRPRDAEAARAVRDTLGPGER